MAIKSLKEKVKGSALISSKSSGDFAIKPVQEGEVEPIIVDKYGDVVTDETGGQVVTTDTLDGQTSLPGFSTKVLIDNNDTVKEGENDMMRFATEEEIKETIDDMYMTGSNSRVVEAPINDTENVVIYGSEVIYTEDDEENPPYSLQSYQGPQFVMCPPFGTSNGISNNSWMDEEDEPIDRLIYMEEWLKLYRDLSSIGMVYLTPTHPKLQDQVYISNGIWVPFNNNKYCVMPNFKVEGRKENPDLGIPGENAVNEPFMKMLGYRTIHLPEVIDGEPCYFEGSADIKMINCSDPHGIVYVCGVGIRTSENAARWIENWLNEIDEDPESHHKVISYLQTDEDTYHVDCAVEPVDNEHTVVYIPENAPQELLDAIEETKKYTTVIPLTDVAVAKAGACNFLRAGNFIFINSDIQMLECVEDMEEDYQIEKRKLEFLQKNVCEPLGLEMNVYCLSEAIKGGACLSCNVADIRGWDFISQYNWAYEY